MKEENPVKIKVFSDFLPNDFVPKKFPITSLPKTCRVKILSFLKDSDDFLSLWKVKMTCKKFNLLEVPVSLPKSFKQIILSQVREDRKLEYDEHLKRATITLGTNSIVLEWVFSFIKDGSFVSDPHVGGCGRTFIKNVAGGMEVGTTWCNLVRCSISWRDKVPPPVADVLFKLEFVFPCIKSGVGAGLVEFKKLF
jgi:hypothetical protein